MIKKIILIFVLFTISLFGQFFKHENGFLMEATHTSYTKKKETTCDVILYMNAPVRLVIAVNTDTQPTKMRIKDFIQFLEDDDPNVLYDDKHGYVIVIYDSEHNNKYIKYILQQILNNNLDIYCEDTFYYFDFTEYKNDIIKNKFYKKIMQ